MIALAASAADSSGGDVSFWAVAGPVIALFAIAVSAFLWWRGRERKALAYEVTVTQLVRPEARDRIDIVYEGISVEDPHLLEVAIANSGNAPLRREDYEGRLKLKFDSEPRLLSVDLIAVEPKELPVHLVVDDRSLEVEPLLLNPRDGFSLQVLIGDAPKGVRLQGRIAGVQEFQSSLTTARDRLVDTTVRIALPMLGLTVEREGRDRSSTS